MRLKFAKTNYRDTSTFFNPRRLIPAKFPKYMAELKAVLRVYSPNCPV